jgi:hypothetical protein
MWGNLMQRRAFLLTLSGGIALALPAFAAFSDDVVTQLGEQGYQNITVSTTWLGRVRILATRDGGTREIVLNPRTGEILRDLWTAADGSQKTVSIVDDVNEGSRVSKSGSASGNASSSGTDGGGTSGSGAGGGTTGGSDGGGTSGGGTSGGGTSGGGTSGGSTGGSNDGGSGSGTGSGRDGPDDGARDVGEKAGE